VKETNLELRCRKLAERMGYVVYKGAGRDGAPDKVFLRNGFGFVVEFKKPKKYQQHNQKIEQGYCESRGVKYYVVKTLEEMREVLLEQEKIHADT